MNFVRRKLNANSFDSDQSAHSTNSNNGGSMSMAKQAVRIDAPGASDGDDGM
jgi:hypothetical protein